jgi:hypothetical protein
MIKFSKILKEMALPKDKWVPIPSSELKDYDKEIFDLISNAYSPMGGHPNYKSTSDVKNQKANYVVINLDSDPDIDAVSVDKTTNLGHKFVATGHDGEKISRSAVINHKVDLLKHPGYYIEVSGKIKDILLAKGVKPITDKETVERILSGKKIEWLGDGYYKRDIGGNQYTKLLMGKPKG